MTQTIRWGDDKGLAHLHQHQLGYIDEANKAIQEILGKPSIDDPDHVRLEMLTRAIDRELSEVYAITEDWGREVAEV
jgi:hypothetical protein